jgi:hypothetical protein
MGEAASIKRRYLRRDINTPLSFEFHEEKRSCLMTSLGEGGLYAETVLPLPLGTRLQIGFELPTGYRIVVTSEVKHSLAHNYSSLPPGFGVQFLDLSEKDREAIVDWVEAGV